jgi:hypothetical protein
MKQTLNAPLVPTAGIAVNKSRLKVYTKGEMPTYYLQKGQEFQIEIFNPTTNVVLAKISLNNTLISQGGLILNPGQRVFLERYIDVPKKFLFDTYEVANTDEVKKAIESNGDVKIEFFREFIPITFYNPVITTLGNIYTPTHVYNNTTIGTDPQYLRGTITNTGLNLTNSSSNTKSVNNNDVKSFYSDNSSATYNADVNYSNTSSSLDSLGFMDMSRNLADEAPVKKQMRGRKLSKSIETGRVDKGSYSSQAFKTVNKSFELWAFHTIEYKLLPISQKINTLEDINVKVYCTNCAHKLKNGYKYCPICATKV